MGNVLQFVGYKNAGKTTFIESLLVYLQRDSYNIATIKHHGHGGEPDGMTDSRRFLEKGATSSLVEGDGTIHLATTVGDGSLKQLVQMQEVLCQPDLILIEGWKQASFPKVVCLRDDQDQDLLSLDSICCVLTASSLRGEAVPYPLFQRDDPAALLFIKELLDREKEVHSCMN
ncbi:molybdopterin-guanine dinucleotide biosynthesis protein B [Shouchella lehensis]|uniref:Molybdopterin-guanine dinucleotide biosynthesis protein B n=1 Tax=Shouchella lehensis G1 TaxID=1246626 RepID=A0A060M561_9BACI|nr:molybdopterin-guanine dinucleotide biosynthesis protein B [Shouchella lehensis]AIC95698.1 Molybdopterin-guanine dinucleotide biosynthesis protein B [Shouchella lehensis G1]